MEIPAFVNGRFWQMLQEDGSTWTVPVQVAGIASQKQATANESSLSIMVRYATFTLQRFRTLYPEPPTGPPMYKDQCGYFCDNPMVCVTHRGRLLGIEHPEVEWDAKRYEEMRRYFQRLLDVCRERYVQYLREHKEKKSTRTNPAVERTSAGNDCRITVQLHWDEAEALIRYLGRDLTSLNANAMTGWERILRAVSDYADATEIIKVPNTGDENRATSDEQSRCIVMLTVVHKRRDAGDGSRATDDGGNRR